MNDVTGTPANNHQSITFLSLPYVHQYIMLPYRARINQGKIRDMGDRPPDMKNNPPKKKTRTSAFGTPGRISHDASPFYASKLYSQVPPAAAGEYIENQVPPEFLNTILVKSSEVHGGNPGPQRPFDGHLAAV